MLIENIKKYVYFLLFIPFFSFAQLTPEAIDGECGSFSGMTIENFPVLSTEFNKLCSKGEFDDWNWLNINSTNPYQIQNFTRRCKGLNGGSDAFCNANGSIHYYDNSIATDCGSSNGNSFMSTSSPLGIAYTNFQNNFLGNLCIKNDGNGQILKVGPVSFNQTALGWVWQCPTLSGRVECSANLYQHASCGESANIGHSYTPTSQLCAPGTIASIITFDPRSYLWRWTCEGNGGANPGYCQAWMENDVSQIQPSCNPLSVNQPDGFFDEKYISSFLGSNACSIGNLSYWSVSNSDGLGKYVAQWKCSTDLGDTSICDKVLFSNFSSVKGYECNDIFNLSGQSNGEQLFFNTENELFSIGLCKGGGVPTYFQTLNDGWTWNCGTQTCNAKRSSNENCGWAIHRSWKNYPTQGLCKTGLVAIMRDIESSGYFRERDCYPEYEPENKVFCKAQRQVDGKCNWKTQINVDGFSTPQQVLDAGLCEDGISVPLVPEQDLNSGKWKWKCSGIGGGQSTDYCYAKVKLPKFEAIFSPEKPLSGSVNGPVVVNLTGFHPLYTTFVEPYNQWYKLFTHNGGYTFKYKDWAGNQGETFVLVDWIDDSLPSAKIVYSPDGPTSGNVEITLTGWISDTITNVYFTGSCLVEGTCSMNSDQYDVKHTIVTFSGNGEGGFVVVDDHGENFLPVVVTGIDRQPPIANLHYSNINPTNQNVIVSVINPSEKIKIINLTGNQVGTGSYIFTGNGQFVFLISDLAGNISYLTATVDRIDKTLPTADILYSNTGIVDKPVIATLTNFNKSGVVVLNNSGSLSYTFDYNKEFTFYIQDSLGNKNHITAKVNWIYNPILPNLISQYSDNICHRFKKRLPVDIQGNEFNLYIITAIRNCLMKGYTMPNNHTYFYPRQPITRGEFITILGRFIKLVSDYEGNIQNILSDKFVNVVATGQFGPEISEADSLGLMFYVPLIQSGTQKYINVKGKVSSKEAKFMIKHSLNLLGIDTKIVDYLIDNDGYLTRGDVAYIFSSLIMNYEGVSIGNNLEFLKFLYNFVKDLTPVETKRFVLRILSKINDIDDTMMERVGLDPVQLKSDLVSIAQGSLPKKKRRVYIRVKTFMDNYLKQYDDPFNDEVFNDNQVYTDKMFLNDEEYEQMGNIYKN